MKTHGDDELDGGPEWLRDAVARLSEPVPRRVGAVDAVVRAALASADRPDVPQAPRSVSRRAWSWLTRPEIRLSPLAAAALVVLLVAPALWLARAPAYAPVAADSGAAGEVVTHQFVLVAPGATSVSLVGDFNGWRVGATQLVRQGTAWTVEVELPPGRHVYSFVVDGDEWVADAAAPRAPEDDFGRPNSVILIPRRQT